jgi:hypothetical protein
MMNVEQSVEWELAGKTEVLGENLAQCHFVHHKSHMTWPGLEPVPGTNCLNYGRACSVFLLVDWIASKSLDQLFD